MSTCHFCGKKTELVLWVVRSNIEVACGYAPIKKLPVCKKHGDERQTSYEPLVKEACHD